MGVQAYVGELAKLLLELGSNPNERAVKQRLHEVTVESSKLMGIMKALNLKVYKAIMEGRMDDGLTDAHRQDAAWYSNFQVSSCVVIIIQPSAGRVHAP